MAKSKTSQVNTNDAPVAIDYGFMNKLQAWLAAGMNAMWVYTQGDEDRVQKVIDEFASRQEGDFGAEPYDVITWNPVAGFIGLPSQTKENSADPLTALCLAPRLLPRRSILVMYDMAPFLNGTNPPNMLVRRQLIELCKSLQLVNDDRSSPILLISNTPVVHSDIKEYVAVVDVTLPNEAQLRTAVVDYIWDSFLRDGSPRFEPTDEIRDRMADALLGLTVEESRRIVSYAVSRGDTPEQCLEYIGEEKSLAIRKIEGLTYIPHRNISAADELGGFDNFLQFLHERKDTYSKNAQKCGIERPRGVALIGVPGTAKTTAAKIAARVLGLDLVQLDISSMFDRWIGSSEQKMRSALEVVGAMKSCVLMIDEIDKALAGAHQNQGSDSGVSSRVLSYLLSWLSNRDMRKADDNRVFVIVTMNRAEGIPPEMLRPGRFDRIFSTRLPDEYARQQILEIHLRKRGLDPAKYDLQTLVYNTDRYAGGELEEVVIAARAKAYSRARQTLADPTPEQVAPTTDDLLLAAKEVIPISRFEGAEIDRVLEFCAHRTVPVGYSVQPKARQRAVRANHN